MYSRHYAVLLVFGAVATVAAIVTAAFMVSGTAAALATSTGFAGVAVGLSASYLLRR